MCRTQVQREDSKMSKMKVQEIARHRNGVSGNGFDVVKFSTRADGNMIAIVFEGAGDCAVFNLDKLTEGKIAFGENSWRGDNYEYDLRVAINKWIGETRP